MHKIGFSTGALAQGDFRRGIDLQRRSGVEAIELSALREHELEPLLAALGELDLTDFAYRSFHAPSLLKSMSAEQLADALAPIANDGWLIVVHPDILTGDLDPWRRLGDRVLLENMDIRKPVCRTSREMRRYFKELPEAQFCFDIGHARQVDPTMSVAVELLLDYRARLAEVHISEVNWECKHQAISTTAAWGFKKVASLIPESTPIIIESVIPEHAIDKELEVVRSCLARNTAPSRSFRGRSVIGTPTAAGSC